ncbi:MAG TPA: hypothetical protein VGW10_11880 [Solirubrobacteraceae bacterium]|nr:hypothetical protein [Solirubrobacteraceae bacterium]
MKRMAALLAVMGALSAVVPAAAPAASTSNPLCSASLLMLRFC